MIDPQHALSEDYKQGWEEGVKSFARQLLNYELNMARDIPSLFRHIERAAFPDVSEGLGSVNSSGLKKEL